MISEELQNAPRFGGPAPMVSPKEHIVIDARGGVSGFFSELVARRELLYFLVWRDIKIRYKQTVFGVLWAVLLPLLQTFLFTEIFGKFAKIGTGGDYPYSAFVLAGLIPWTLFSQAVTIGSQSLVNQQHLMTKVYFPRLYVPAAAVGSCLVDFAVGMVLFGLILWYLGITPPIGIVALPLLIVLMMIATLGTVFFLAALSVSYRDFKYIVPFGVQALMYISPVIYPTTMLPERYRLLLSLNPMTGIIDGFRSAILNKPWDLNLLLLSTLSAVVLFIVGTMYFKGTERRFADIA